MSSDEAGPPPRRASSRKRLVLGLVGVLAFAAVLYFAGLERLPVLLEADLYWVALAFAALVSVTVVSTIRWGSISDALAGGSVLRFREYYAALLASRVLGLFVSRSGSDLGVRFAALTGARRGSVQIAGASLFLDQMFDLCLLAAWIIPSLAILAGDISAAPGIALLVAASGLALAAMVNLHRILSWAVGALGWTLGILARLRTPAKVRRFLAARQASVARLRDVEHLTRPRLLWLAAVTFVRYLLNAFMFFAISQALHLDIGWGVFVLTGALVQLSLVVAATPGGLGVADAGWVLALATAGVPAEVSAVFLVGQRAFQYVGFPALAAVSAAIAFPSRRHAPSDAAAEPDLAARRR